MTLRRVLLVVGLLSAVVLERGAYYSARSVLLFWMTGDLGVGLEDALEVYGYMSVGLTFAPVLGGVVAIGIGPRITTALGAFFMALGYGALFVATTGSPTFGIVLIVVGSGLFRPALFAALAQEIAHPHGNARTAVFLMVYFGINVAAMAGPLVGGQLGEAVGFGLVFGLSAAVCLVSALLAAGVGGVHHRVGTKPQPGTFGAGPVLGAIVLLVLSLPYFLGMGALGTLQVAATPFGEPGSDGLPFVALNPIVISLVTLFAAVGFAVAAFMKARPMSLYVAGGGLLVFALGLGAGAFVEPESGLGVALLLAIVLTAIGEGLTGGVVLARVAADVHPRLGTLVFALFLVLSSGAPYLASFANEVESVRIAVGVCALFSFGAGAVLLAVAGPMQRAFYSPRDEATPTGAESAP